MEPAQRSSRAVTVTNCCEPFRSVLARSSQYWRASSTHVGLRAAFPSATLERRFPHQRRDLETIVSMSDHDSQLTRIDPTWLIIRDGRQFLAYSPESGITRERWEEYRRLFSATASPRVSSTTPKPGTPSSLSILLACLIVAIPTAAIFIVDPVQNTSIPHACPRNRRESILTNRAMKPIPFANWLNTGTRTARVQAKEAGISENRENRANRGF